MGAKYNTTTPASNAGIIQRVRRAADRLGGDTDRVFLSKSVPSYPLFIGWSVRRYPRTGQQRRPSQSALSVRVHWQPGVLRDRAPPVTGAWLPPDCQQR